MTWEAPTYTDIEMNAEISGYQDDFGKDRRRDVPGLQLVTPPADPVKTDRAPQLP
jgi:hypothetical protein